MSVLMDVLDKMMADFFTKEAQWKDYQDRSWRQPETFSLELDSPEFRQLIKELCESVMTEGNDGITSYRRRKNLDGTPYDAPDVTDATLRQRRMVAAVVLYPYPANEYIYSATIRHRCTLAPDINPQPATPLSFVERLAAFREADRRDLGPVANSPGYRRDQCNCVACRFAVTERDRERGEGAPRSLSEPRRWVAEFVGPQPAPVPPAPAPSHPNDPRPRMPRLSDGSPSPVTVERSTRILNSVWRRGAF